MYAHNERDTNKYYSSHWAANALVTSFYYAGSIRSSHRSVSCGSSPTTTTGKGNNCHSLNSSLAFCVCAVPSITSSTGIDMMILSLISLSLVSVHCALGCNCTSPECSGATGKWAFPHRKCSSIGFATPPLSVNSTLALHICLRCWLVLGPLLYEISSRGGQMCSND